MSRAGRKTLLTYWNVCCSRFSKWILNYDDDVDNDDDDDDDDDIIHCSMTKVVMKILQVSAVIHNVYGELTTYLYSCASFLWITSNPNNDI